MKRRELLKLLNEALPDEMPSVTDVSAVFGVGRATLWNWRKAGKLATRVSPTGKRFIAHADIADAIVAGDLDNPFETDE